jgi:hypothetical protein
LEAEDRIDASLVTACDVNIRNLIRMQMTKAKVVKSGELIWFLNFVCSLFSTGETKIKKKESKIDGVNRTFKSKWE